VVVWKKWQNRNNCIETCIAEWYVCVCVFVCVYVYLSISLPPCMCICVRAFVCVQAGNTKGGCITVPLTSCLAGLESAAWQLTFFVFIWKTDYSKLVKQEVNGTVILPPLAFPGTSLNQSLSVLPSSITASTAPSSSARRPTLTASTSGSGSLSWRSFRTSISSNHGRRPVKSRRFLFILYHMFVGILG
jgi:hypothetical protein